MPDSSSSADNLQAEEHQLGQSNTIYAKSCKHDSYRDKAAQSMQYRNAVLQAGRQMDRDKKNGASAIYRAFPSNA